MVFKGTTVAPLTEYGHVAWWRSEKAVMNPGLLIWTSLLLRIPPIGLKPLSLRLWYLWILFISSGNKFGIQDGHFYDTTLLLLFCHQGLLMMPIIIANIYRVIIIFGPMLNPPQAFPHLILIITLWNTIIISMTHKKENQVTKRLNSVPEITELRDGETGFQM